MRQAGTIATRQDAERFVNYLLTLGITAKVDRAGDEWAIWIHDENQVPRSREELAQFQRAPGDARYQQAEQAAKLARRAAADKERQARKNYIDLRDQWASPWRRRPVTLVLVVTCVALGLGLFGIDRQLLMFSWSEIRVGQVWRLVTPALLHLPISAGPWHLIFNMLMLYNLGTVIERQMGSLRFVLLVLASALVGNVAQATMVGPNFVGMSGVIYGLFGFAWVRGRLDPTSGLYLRPDYVVLMIGWFVVCAVGIIGDVANWAHGGGLVAGAALGYVAHTLARGR
jgi:GlpG protein